MSWMHFIVDIVRAVAWPGVVLALVIILRDPIAKLFGQRLSSLEGLGLRAEFDRARSEVLSDVEEAASNARSPLPSSPPVATVDPELARRVGSDPRGTLLTAFEAVEADLRRRLAAAGEVLDVARSGTQLATLAAEKGVITPASLEAVRGLSVMRNLAAHSNVTAAQAIDFLALADAVLYSFRLSGSIG